MLLLGYITLQDESGEIGPIFFNFREGKSLATNAFGDQNLRVMDVNNKSDLRKILSARNQIKKTCPVWDDGL